MPMPEMTPRERFLYAFTHREGDRVPIFEAIANPRLYPEKIGEENYYYEGAKSAKLIRALGMDGVHIEVGGFTSHIGPYQNWSDKTHFTDEFGVPHIVSEASWPLAMASGHAFPDRESWEKGPRPDPLADWRYESLLNGVKESIRGKADDVSPVAAVRGAFTVMFISMGFENMAMTLYDDEDLLREMSAWFTDFWTKISLRCVECGADAIYIANDMGFNTNTLMSPEAMRDIFLPDLEKQVRTIKATGAKVILHSCGNLNPILPEIVDTGIDALTNLQVSAEMDLEQIKRDYGDRITIMGNVDSTNVLSIPDNKKAIEEEVIRKLRIGAPGGGYVMSTDHSLHQGIPIENVDYYLEFAKRYGKYPLELPE